VAPDIAAVKKRKIRMVKEKGLLGRGGERDGGKKKELQGGHQASTAKNIKKKSLGGQRMIFHQKRKTKNRQSLRKYG